MVYTYIYTGIYCVYTGILQYISVYTILIRHILCYSICWYRIWFFLLSLEYHSNMPVCTEMSIDGIACIYWYIHYIHRYIIVYTTVIYTLLYILPFAIVYGGIGFLFCCCHQNMPVCTEMLIAVIAYQDIAEVQ